MNEWIFKKGAAYINHQLAPIQDAKIPILDWGFLHSDATYNVAHVWQGKFFRIDGHIPGADCDSFAVNAQAEYMIFEVPRFLIFS